MRAAGIALAVAAGLAATGIAVVGSTPAAGAPADETPALVLITDPPGTVHELRAGVPALWDVGVTVRRMPVRTLVAVVAAEGRLAVGDTYVPAEIEVRGCAAPWRGTGCESGERLILPATATDRLSGASEGLTDPSRPVPPRVWVQARVTLPSDSPAGTAGELRVRLTVDAFGADPVPGRSSSLAGTGSSPLGAGLLASAAVVAGLAVTALVRRRRHG